VGFVAESPKLRAGLRWEADEPGKGPAARRGDRVTVAYSLSLNRGEVVQTVESYSFTLGRRQVVAALDYGVEGMRVGGRRRFRAGSHLAYRDEGVPGVVPPGAVLIFDVRLLAIDGEA
jgi:FKBP-type peptidyl-prolyl cis-trans isomerase